MILALALLSSGAVQAATPSFEEVRAGYRSSDVRVLDRSGHLLQEVRTDARGRRVDWIPLADVSPRLLEAVIAAEDHRFREHSGVDWLALSGAAARALWTELREGKASSRGASTITMQLVSMLDSAIDRMPARRRSLAAKLRQVREARELESAWTKEQILEAYLNLVSFRGELQGVAAASRGLFGKHPHGLDEREASLLAALLRAPNASARLVAGRACALLAPENNDCAPTRELAEKALTAIPQIALPEQKARHAALYAIGKSKGSSTLRTTLDLALQARATEAIRGQIAVLAEQNVRDASALVLENATGKVLAYVGTSGALSSAPWVDGVQAKRQAGSTLKPFLYGAAIEQRILTPASLLLDEPTSIASVQGIYSPDNYDHRYRGWVSVRSALASSLNIPAVKAIDLVGVSAMAEMLRRLSFSGLRQDDYYGHSLALGAVDVSLWELARAYRAVARGGLDSPLRIVEGETVGPDRRVLSAPVAFVLGDILADRGARAATFGWESVLSTPYWSAVKTGTSKDMRDNWCVGFSRRHTVAVWVGNFGGEPMWSVSGMSGAAPIWRELMDALRTDDLPASVPHAPKGLARRNDEWFLAGTEPREGETTLGPVNDAPLQAISSPVADAIFAIDPDMPPGRQKVFFEPRLRNADDRWFLDGSPVGDASKPFAWEPARGDHRLELKAPDGRVWGRVAFGVR